MLLTPCIPLQSKHQPTNALNNINSLQVSTPTCIGTEAPSSSYLARHVFTFYNHFSCPNIEFSKFRIHYETSRQDNHATFLILILLILSCNTNTNLHILVHSTWAGRKQRVKDTCWCIQQPQLWSARSIQGKQNLPIVPRQEEFPTVLHTVHIKITWLSWTVCFITNKWHTVLSLTFLWL